MNATSTLKEFASPREPLPTFEGEIRYEVSQQPIANSFISEMYPGAHFWRPDMITGGDLQRKDIDVVLELPGKMPNPLYISEKFRRRPWDDILIELYSDFKHGTEGWGLTSQAHEHWYYLQCEYKEAGKAHAETYVKILPTWAIRRIAAAAREALMPELTKLFESGRGYKEVPFWNNPCPLIIAPTFVNGKIAWKSACVAINEAIFRQINCYIKTYKIELP